MSKFNHIHSSSRYDRSLTSLRAAVERYTADADLITYTEVDFESREGAVRRGGGREFDEVFGDESHANDCGIQYRKSRFELLYSEQYQNATQEIYRVDGVKRDLPYSTIAVLRDKTNDKVLVVSVGHYASGVEGELFRNNQTYRRAIQWRQSARNTKKRVNRLAKKYKADARVIVADWNVNFKKAWVRAMVKAIAPAYTNAWVNVNIKGGTHGNRIIDGTILRGKLKVKGSAGLYADDTSSDHRPYIETLVWS